MAGLALGGEPALAQVRGASFDAFRMRYPYSAATTYCGEQAGIDPKIHRNFLKTQMAFRDRLFGPRRWVPSAQPPAPLCAGDKVQKILAALEGLTAREIEMLRRFYLEGQAEQEILREFHATREELASLRRRVRDKALAKEDKPVVHRAAAGAGD